MKTYREMTESVLQKAGAEIQKRERRLRNGVFIAASGLCLALVLTVVGVGMGKTPEVVPTETNQQPNLSVDATQPVETQAKLKVTYLSDIEGQTTQETVTAGVRIPLSAMVRVRDIRNLSKSDVDKVMEEERTFGKEYLTGRGGYTSLYQGTGAVLSIFSNGSITLDLSECDPVKNVEIKSSNKGVVYGASGQMRELPPEGTPIHSYWPYMLEAYIEWELPIEARNALNENPDLPLSFIEDTITVTIHYENGAIETLVFNITVNDEGQIFVSQRGIPTEAT